MSKRFHVLFILALLASSLGTAVTYTPARAAANRWYAKPAATGSGDCSSWANACTLQDAIAQAVASAGDDEIWVMKGTHKPDASLRWVSFTLRNGVAIYGGFAGGETDITERDPNPATNGTILSGDIGTPNDASDNSYHVVASINKDESAILDGFTIRDGTADGSDPLDLGGGMYNEGGGPTVSNVIFSRNSARWGGGMFDTGGNPTLTNVTFDENSATSEGGGMHVRGSSSTLIKVIFKNNSAPNGGGMFTFGNGVSKLTDVTFSNNSASNAGGGMYSHTSSPVLKNVTFSENSAGSAGGGMVNLFNNGSPTLTNVTFSGNSAGSNGGGMYSGTGTPTLRNVTFFNNSAYTGGGMHNQNSQPTLTNATFSENHAGNCGGGMYNANGSPTLTNTTFSANTGEWCGGGMYTENGSPGPTLKNVTFSHNSANNVGGGAMYISPGGNVVLVNVIMANSTAGGDCKNFGGLAVASSSNNLIESTGATACNLTNGANGNLIGVDPKLGPLASNGGFTQTHALLPGSPAIDTGDDATCAAAPVNNRDQRGIPRPKGPHCDIGAFESRIFTIKGNAGAAGVILNYAVAAVAKKATSNAKGIYALAIPEGWTGTVTPSHACYNFNPASRNYNTPVTTNQPGQNYTPTFKTTSPCAQVTLKTGQTQTEAGTFVIPKNRALERAFAADVGYLSLNGTGNNVRFIASQRIANNSTHFFELIGLPANLARSSYAFPAYDNVGFNSQLRVVNVGNQNTTVSVTLKGAPVGSFPLAPGASLRTNLTGGNDGPLLVGSSGNVPIVASLRVISKPNNGSFSEILGLPRPQWSTTYSFPRYDNVNLNTQLRVGNVGGSTTTVTVTVRGQEVDRFDIGSGKGVRRSILNLNDGPIKVTSLGGVLIVASLRVALPTGPNTFTNFSEMMGLPESQLDNLYVFPWYTNTATLPMKLWLANPNDTPASVDVFLAGRRVPGSPFAVPAGKTIVKTFANANSGPLKVVEVGNKNILASLSVQFQAGGASYSEWMGLPESQLFTRYLFPWYTNNATTKTRLRVAVPDVP